MTELLSVQDVEIGPEKLRGRVRVPPAARGIVLFAHGSGSGRFSPRNNHVAEGLRDAGFATLLLDLLTPEEERDRANVFDIGLLAHRLGQATEWVLDSNELHHVPIGYFGASTGAGAALLAAAEPNAAVRAVVSRGGRPDLAADALPEVKAPTLLLVGSLDVAVITLNRLAYERMTSVRELVLIPGAGHLFEEPGTLDAVMDHATQWFVRYLPET